MLPNIVGLMTRISQNSIVYLITMYRKGISPFIPGVCRHMPTCSVYSIEAVEKYGPWRGTYVAARRLIRCTPLGTGGYDPVP